MSALDPLAGLRGLLEAGGDHPPLDRALLEIARVDREQLDERRALNRLDELAEGVGERLAVGGDELEAMRGALFDRFGLHGNEEDYYAPDNSHLDQVLESRRGQPILLAAVWLEVARRAGLRAEGVGFPGHFLVRHRVDGTWRYLDVFGGGEVLSMERLRGLLGGREVDPRMLDTVTPRAMLLRVTFNLKHAYARRQDALGVVRAVDRILLVEPSLTTEHRDRGLAYASVGLPGPAIEDLRAYLDSGMVPEPERQTLEALVARIRPPASEGN